MPADLVTAFQATLEELAEADILLHVVDAHDSECEAKFRAVQGLLVELKISEIPRLLILNKCDLLDEEQLEALVQYFNGVAVSSITRKGLGKLVDRAEQLLSEKGQGKGSSWLPKQPPVSTNRS
jgi:GTP-binding protein HflX